MNDPSLLAHFLAARPPEDSLQAPEVRADLEARLAGMWQRARAAFPGVELSAAAFGTHLAAVLPEAAGPPDLDGLRADELYLTDAAGAHDPHALHVLEVEYFSRLDGTLRRAGGRDDGLDEAKQRLREDLLVAAAGQRPRITTYGGRGDLLSWLRISAVRALYKLRRGAPRVAVTIDEDVLSATLSGGDPELAHVLNANRQHLRQALQAAIGTLQPDDRALLRAHHLEGQSIDVLAAQMGIHRATVARRLERAREALGQAVRRYFAQRFSLGRNSCDSLVRGVVQGLDVTMSALDV